MNCSRTSRVLIIAPFAAALAMVGCATEEVRLADLVEEAADHDRPFYLVTWSSPQQCSACRQMQEMWRDPKVVQWSDDHASRRHIDYFRDWEAAHAIGVRAIPTTVVYAGGREIDRARGSMSAEMLHRWLTRLEQGERFADLLRDIARVDPTGEYRYRLAQELTRLGERAEATRQWLTLWEQHESLDRVSGGNVLLELAETARDDPESRALVRRFRDERIEDPTQWLLFSYVAGDDAALVAWLEGTDEAGREMARRRAPMLTRMLRDALASSGHWDGLLRMYELEHGDVLAHVDAFATWKQKERGRVHRIHHADIDRELRQELEVIYAALLAQGRDDDAQTVARTLIDAVDTPRSRLALVEWAMRAEQPRPVHLRWLEEADAAGAPDRQLRTAVYAALTS